MLNKEIVYFWTPNKKLPEYVVEVLDLPYKFIYNDKNPDIIFLSYIPRGGWKVKTYREILRLRFLFGWRPILCMKIGENMPLFYGEDISLSFNPSNKKNIYWPFWLSIKIFQDLLLGKGSKSMDKWYKVPKTQFCNFVYRSGEYDAWIREDFCQLLSKYKRVDCPGKRLNNMTRVLPGHITKLDLLAKYRFTIAFEHEASDYYITEKIMDAFTVGSIPIYWGASHITDFFNPAAFVNCHDFNSFDDVVARIKQIDSDPKLYQSYIQAPPILPNSRIHLVIEETKHRFTLLINKALKQRHRKENRLLMKIRLVFLMLSYLHLEIEKWLYDIVSWFGINRQLRTLVNFFRSSPNRSSNKLRLKD